MSNRVIIRGRSGRIQNPFHAKEVTTPSQHNNAVVVLGPFTQQKLSEILYRVKELTVTIEGTVDIEYQVAVEGEEGVFTTETATVNAEKIGTASRYMARADGYLDAESADEVDVAKSEFAIVISRNELDLNGEKKRPQVDWTFAVEGDELFPSFSIGNEDMFIPFTNGATGRFGRPVEKITGEDQYYFFVGGKAVLELSGSPLAGTETLGLEFAHPDALVFGQNGVGTIVFGDVEEVVNYNLDPTFDTDADAYGTASVVGFSLEVRVEATKWFPYANADGQPIWDTETGDRTENPFS